MKALYSGSFDPFTIGHLSIAHRALVMFDSLVIGVGYNESKMAESGPDERVAYIKSIFSGMPNVEVASYSGLTVDFAKKCGARILVRGLRNTIDFEKEKELAEINKSISGIDTVFLPAEPELAFVSSSMVRELMHNGYDISRFLPVAKNPS